MKQYAVLTCALIFSALPLVILPLWQRGNVREPISSVQASDKADRSAQQESSAQARQLERERTWLKCLTDTVRRGRIVYLGAGPDEPIVTAYDLSKIAPIDALFRKRSARCPESNGQVQMGHGLEDEYVEFLREVECVLYFSGYKAEAEKYHQSLKEYQDYPDSYPDLENDVLGRVRKFVDEYGTHSQVRSYAEERIAKACLFLACNELDEARLHENIARLSWKAYCEYTEAQAQGKRRPQPALPDSESIERKTVLNVLSGKTPFPAPLMKPLRAALKIAHDADLDKVTITLPLVAPIPPDSPLPK